jgi:hypothetical protein
VTRTVDLLARVLDEARLPVRRLSGLFLVGGSSRIPLIATPLHRRFGIAPMLVDQPELVVALGSLRVPGSTAPAPGEPESTAAPVEPPAAPPASPGPRRRRRVAVALPALLVLALLCAWQVAGQLGRHTGGSGPSGAGPQTSSAGGRGAQRLAIDKTAWYGGFRATFGTATYGPAANPPLAISAKVQNLGRKDQALFEHLLPISVTLDGRTTAGTFPGPTVTVGSGSTIDVTVAFDLKDPVANLSAGVLTVGDNDALVPRCPSERVVRW